VATAERAQPLKKPVPGRLFRWVKIVSWFESCLFAALLFFWIAPGYGSQTGLFGLLHGVGYLGLCALVFAALLRHEAPWPLFAATLTPIGPFGTVIGIELIERKGWGIERPAAAGIDSGNPTGKNQRRREDVLT
jgi:hypothetical protein